MVKKSLAKNGMILALASILVFTASWAVYKMINQGAAELLASQGVTNVYYQSLIVIAFVLVILTIVGLGFQTTLKKILRIS